MKVEVERKSVSEIESRRQTTKSLFHAPTTRLLIKSKHIFGFHSRFGGQRNQCILDSGVRITNTGLVGAIIKEDTKRYRLKTLIVQQLDQQLDVCRQRIAIIFPQNLDVFKLKNRGNILSNSKIEDFIQSSLTPSSVSSKSGAFPFCN